MEEINKQEKEFYNNYYIINLFYFRYVVYAGDVQQALEILGSNLNSNLYWTMEELEDAYKEDETDLDFDSWAEKNNYLYLDCTEYGGSCIYLDLKYLSVEEAM